MKYNMMKDIFDEVQDNDGENVFNDISEDWKVTVTPYNSEINVIYLTNEFLNIQCHWYAPVNTTPSEEYLRDVIKIKMIEHQKKEKNK